MSLKAKEMTMIALFAALIGVAGYITIPIPPVPITAQTLVVMLAGLVLSPRLAAFSIMTFIFIGSVGVPVFSNGRAGIQVFLTPSGGYIVGFLIGVIVISLLKGKGTNMVRNFLASFVGGVIVVYAIGVPWMANILGFDFHTAIFKGIIPFLLGDTLKVLLASFLAIRINKQFGVIGQKNE